MKYSPKYFHDNMPAWKRKKDCLLCRFFFRPISFVIASLCTNLGINANAISIFSIFVGVTGSILFLFDSYWLAITGTILILLWYLLDCVDGNLARSFRKQPYGDFVDSMSSYITYPFLCLGVSVYAFKKGGVLFDTNFMWIIVIGAFAGFCDILGRLAYHKYKEGTKMLIEKGIIEEKDEVDKDKPGKLKEFINHMQEAVGLGGWLPVIVLFGVIFNFMDVVSIYCLAISAVMFIGMFGMLLLKTLKYRKMYLE